MLEFHGGPSTGRFPVEVRKAICLLTGKPCGTCVCPRCGYIRVHERDTPCTAAECPQCGAPMTQC